MNPNHQKLTEALAAFIEAEVVAQVEKRLAEMHPQPTREPGMVPLGERGALSVTETAFYLGVCEKTVHTHVALKRLARTEYGMITVESIKRHLAEQTPGKKARKRARRAI